MAAVNTFNGEEVGGRKLLVREDREDRDVKQYNRENGIERPEGSRPSRRSRRGSAAAHSSHANGGDKPAGSTNGGEETPEPSGLQVGILAM